MNRLIDYFIHPDIQKNELAHKRARILAVALLSFFIILSLYTIFFISNGEVFNDKAIYNYIGLAAQIIALMAMKRSADFTNVFIFISIVGFGLITVSAYLSGGISSFDIFWYIVLSTTATMFISHNYGLFMAGCSVVAISTYYVLELNSMSPEPTNALSLTAHYKFINSIFILFILCFLVQVLARGNKQLQQLIQKSKEDQLRHEFTRDFHDMAGNKLASIRHLSQLAQTSQNDNLRTELIEKIEKNSIQLYTHFKTFLWAQKEQNQNADELLTHLKDFAEDLIKSTNIDLFVDINPHPIPNNSVPGNISHQVAAIFNEALTNIIKHARATEIRVIMTVEKNNLRLIIQDNGIGIDPNKKLTGNGLKNMLIRAEKINALLTVNSTKGTKLELSLKLPD